MLRQTTPRLPAASGCKNHTAPTLTCPTTSPRCLSVWHAHTTTAACSGYHIFCRQQSWAPLHAQLAKSSACLLDNFCQRPTAPTNSSYHCHYRPDAVVLRATMPSARSLYGCSDCQASLQSLGCVRSLAPPLRRLALAGCTGWKWSGTAAAGRGLGQSVLRRP